MKYVDDFRQPGLCRDLTTEILRVAHRRWTIMEVCGGQTHSLLRHGIDEALQPAVELIHGPGCPVCVTPAEIIDQACALAIHEQVILASFGDMLRVPGNCCDLLAARAAGGDVRLVYSPLDAVQLAAQQRDRQVVFLAVGFETTVPATALALSRAEALGLDNFTVLAAHVRVLPAMELIADQPDCRIQGFLAAGHVCTVTGYADYHAWVAKYRLPTVIAGFEPVDLLAALHECVLMLEQDRPGLCNAYARSVNEAGNPRAQQLIEHWFQPTNAPWRGIGVVPGGGLALRPWAAHFDAAHRWPATLSAAPASTTCRAAEVLLGQIKPHECQAFGTLCTPERPLGAPMVSTEGACAAYLRYASVRGSTTNATEMSRSVPS